jgi:hypothetical protein
LAALLLVTLCWSCSAADATNEPASGDCEPVAIATSSEALSSIDCTESTDTGYSSGNAFTITVVTVDGKKVEKDTANAYYVMAQAAANAGVNPE